MQADQLDNFKDKKIFITGHTGFKGSWLTYWLHNLGAIVKGFSLAPYTSPNLFDCLQLNKTVESVIGNINDYSLLQKEVISFKPDYIFHLAAQPLVRKSYIDPLDTFQTNVSGTANVIQSLRFVDNACVCICITTDKVYHNNEWVFPYRENDRLGGYDPYSASKACSEIVISSFTNSFLNPDDFANHKKAIASARAGNVIGGGDWSEDRLLPDIAKALNNNNEIIIRNPNSIRPWQHVMEPLFGYMILGLQLSGDAARYSGAWNFGPASNDSLSVETIANMATDIWGKGKLDIQKDVNAVHEAQLLRLDISKAIEGLKWTPKLNAKQAMERTINWYKEFYAGRNAADLINEDLVFYKTFFD